MDTGAKISVFPASSQDTRKQWVSDIVLEAGNGSTIRTFGERELTLSLCGRQFRWVFIIADVTQPLLGADFLCANNLMLDLHGQRLIDTSTSAVLPLHATAGVPQHIHIATDNEYTALLSRYPDLLSPSFSTPTTKHGVVHHITTDGPPIYCRPRRLPPEKLAIAKEEFRNMEEMGVTTSILTW